MHCYFTRAKGRPTGAPLFLLLLTWLTMAPAVAQRGAERIMPPATLTCGRNNLTSYNGRLVEYTETGTSLRIVIDTDWDTREVVALMHAPGEDPKASFLLHGELFEDDDWQRIGATREARNPATGTRLVAWVCLDDETKPVIDWRP